MAPNDGNDPVTPDFAPTPDQAMSLLEPLTAVVARAAAAIRAIPHATVARRLKADGTAVTAADEASDATIIAGLRQLAPRIPVVSEEQTPPAIDGRVFFSVDPLDGTREYLDGNDNYTINVALIADGQPLLGIIAAPARNILWRGVVGRGAERLALRDDLPCDPRPIRTRPWPVQGAIALMSRSHLDPVTQKYLQGIPAAAQVAYGSSIKFCMIADGTADIYPRFGETSEWDIAAGHALVVAAGGVMTSPDGSALKYGNAGSDFAVPGFIAWGDASRAR